MARLLNLDRKDDIEARDPQGGFTTASEWLRDRPLGGTSWRVADLCVTG